MNDKDFLSIIKNIDPEYTENPETTTSFLDSGSYILNALLSGSLYGGFPSNKVSALAGEEAVGKSFFAMSAVKAFQEKYPESFVVYFDSEFALDRSFLEKRGINSKRVHIMQCETLQDFRTRALKLLDNYKDMNPRPKMMLVLDSLSNLPSNKEIQDGLEDKDVRDMTKNQLIRSIFRSITTKLGKYDVPMIVTSHVYQIIGCLDCNQKIKMSNGQSKYITDIKVGDLVKTLSGDKPVTQLFEYEVNEYIEIELENGNVIKATPNHKFLTKNLEWIRADMITKETQLLVN